MSSDTIEMKSLLNSLNKKMNTSCDGYTGQHIGMCYYGLQNMKNEKFLEKLLDKLNNRLYYSIIL